MGVPFPQLIQAEQDGLSCRLPGTRRRGFQGWRAHGLWVGRAHQGSGPAHSAAFAGSLLSERHVCARCSPARTRERAALVTPRPRSVRPAAGALRGRSCQSAVGSRPHLGCRLPGWLHHGARGAGGAPATVVAARSQSCPLEWSLEPISQRRKPSGEAQACHAGPVRTGATPSRPGRPGRGLGCGLTGLCGAL